MTFVTPAPALAVFAPTAPSLWERLASLRAGLAERAAQRRLYRSTLAELDALSDRERTVVAEWSLAGVIPVRWTGPSLSAESPKVAIETIELAHHGFLPNVVG